VKWLVVTNKRRFEIEAEKRFDAERKAWKRLEIGEEIYAIIPPELVNFS
jgi:hypothetical protein